MWQCSALLVSCILAVVLSDTIFDGPKKNIERIRSISATESPHRRAVTKPQIKKSVPQNVKRVVPNRRVSESVRGTRNTLFPFEEAQFQGSVGETGPGLVVESSRLNIKVPPSRQYYNPALKKEPFPFEQLPIEQPYPFQNTAFGGLYPTGSGLQFEDSLLPTTASDFPPTAIASLPPTSFGALDFTSPGFVTDSWRSYQHIPGSAPPAVPNFSTRPPWIPRGGKSDFKPQRGNPQTGSAPGNQVSSVITKRPSVTAGNISELIKMVEQFIIASSQNSTTTNTTHTAIPGYKRFFKHPSVG